MNRLKSLAFAFCFVAMPIASVFGSAVPGPQQIYDPSNLGPQQGFGTVGIFAGTAGAVQGQASLFMFSSDAGGTSSANSDIISSRTTPGTNNTDTTLTFLTESATGQYITIGSMSDGTGFLSLGSNGGTAVPAGFVGQLITSQVVSGSAVSLTTATTANVTSISLTPGVWDVWTELDLTLAGATTTLVQWGISTVSATLPAVQDQAAALPITLTTSSLAFGLPGPTFPVNVATTATYFFVARGTFSAGTEAAYGTIYARRRQ